MPRTYTATQTQSGDTLFVAASLDEAAEKLGLRVSTLAFYLKNSHGRLTRGKGSFAYVLEVAPFDSF